MYNVAISTCVHFLNTPSTLIHFIRKRKILACISNFDENYTSKTLNFKHASAKVITSIITLYISELLAN